MPVDLTLKRLRTFSGRLRSVSKADLDAQAGVSSPPTAKDGEGFQVTRLSRSPFEHWSGLAANAAYLKFLQRPAPLRALRSRGSGASG